MKALNQLFLVKIISFNDPDFLQVSFFQIKLSLHGVLSIAVQDAGFLLKGVNSALQRGYLLRRKRREDKEEFAVCFEGLPRPVCRA